jgi:hypothetical protein
MTSIIEASTWDPDQPAPTWFKGKAGTTRTAADVPAFLWHQTAVAGGFGVSSQALARHDGDEKAALMERFTGSEYLRQQELDQGKDGDVGEPYHYVYRPQENEVLAVWHPSRYTYHGNGGNSYSIGCAIDGKYPGDEFDPDALGFAWVSIVEHARAAGFEPHCLEYHRQHSSGRGGDPGEDVALVVDELARCFAIKLNPEDTTGSGQTVPMSWRADTGVSLEPEHDTLNIATMSSSNEDPRVKDLQGHLLAFGFGPSGLVGSDGAPDGKPGPGTERELRSFQSSRGLQADAVAGPSTWAALHAF